MAVDRSWSQSNLRFQSSQLKKIVSAVPNCLERGSWLGFLWNDGLGFLSSCLRSVSWTCTQVQNTGRIQHDIGRRCVRKFIANWFFPFRGGAIRNRQSFSEKTLVPQAVRGNLGVFQACFASPTTFWMFPPVYSQRSSLRKEAIKEVMMHTQTSPSSFQIEIITVFTEVETQSRSRMLILSSCPDPRLGSWALQGTVRESFYRSISVRSYLVNFHFGKDLGVNLQPKKKKKKKCWPS